MRNLNFLRKSERKSVGTTLALTVGSPSAHRRYSALKHLAFMLLFLLGSLNVWGASPETFNTTNSVFSNGTKTIAPITITFASSGPSWQSDHVRFYSNNTLNISCTSGYTITDVTINAKSGYTNAVLSGFDANSGNTQYTWSGSASSIDVTNTGSAQARITSIVVTYSASSSPDPTLSADPVVIDFGTVDQNADVAAKTVEITYANLTGSVTYSGLSGAFTASGTIAASGNKITITPNTANTGNFQQTLTVQSEADSKSAEVTVKMNVLEPFDGKKLTFDVSSNPGEWPTSNSTTTTNYTYTLNEVDYTFALNNVKCNSGYLMLTSVAKLGLPAISGYKLVKVEATNSGSCSTTTQVSVSSSDASKTDVTGGAAQTWGTTNTKYTYNLSETEENTMYYLWIANKNCQLVTLELYYEEVAAAAVAKPTISGTESFLESTEVTLACTTEGATIYYSTDGSDPKTSGTTGTSFTLFNDATVRAIAKKDEAWSEEATPKAFTKKTPITVAQALDIIEALPNKTATTEDYLVEGTISTITSVTVGGTAEYYISADGTTTNELQVYKGKYKNQENFTSVDDIQEGDDVVIYGKLKKYNDYKELDQNNYVYSQKAKARLSWSAESYTASLVGSNTFPTLTNTNGVAVTYSSSDPSVASFTNASDYSTLTLNAAGTDVTISATFEGNSTYKANTVTYTLNVEAAVERGKITFDVDGGNAIDPIADATELPNPLPIPTKAGKNFVAWYTNPGKTDEALAGATVTEDITLYAKWREPYSVTEALAIIATYGNNEGGTNDVYVAGIVSTAPSSNPSSGKLTYSISVDGTASDEIKVYLGKGVDDASFTNKTDVQLDDKVVVYGKLYKYEKNSEITPEVNTPNYLYSLSRKAEAELDWSASSAVVGITGDKNYPTIVNPNSLTGITYSSSDPTVASFEDENTYAITLHKAGTVTITATFDGDEDYKNDEASYTLEVRDVLVYVTITYDCDGATTGCPDPATVENQTNLPNPLPTVTKDGFKFGGWFTNAGKTEAATAGAALTDDITLYAKWNVIPTFDDPNYEWQLVTSDAQLVAGKYYVIAYSGNNHTMKYAESGTYYETVSSIVSDNVIAYDALGASTAIFELGGTSIAWTLTEAINDVQLGANSNKNMVWGTNTTWTIAIDEDNNATITNVTTNHVLCYNNSANPKRFKVYDAASNNCPLPQLYVWAEKVYKLRYDANGGENAPAAQPAVAGQATVTNAKPTKEDKIFKEWNTLVGGDGEAKAAGEVIDLSAGDVTLYAQWRDPETVTVSYDANEGTGEMAADAGQVEGSTYTIKTNAFERNGYLFAGWKAYDANDVELKITNGKFTVPATNVTVKAQWQSANDSKWVLVEYLSQLADGDKVIIAAKDSKYALGAEAGSTNKYRAPEAANKAGKLLIPTAGATQLTLGKSGDYYTFKDGDNYLMWSSGNTLPTEISVSDNSRWTISFEEGVMHIVNKTDENRQIQYNDNSGQERFATYTGSQKAVVIYKYLDMDPTDEDSGHERVDLVLNGIGTICLPYNVKASDRFGGVFYMPSHKTSGFANFVEETGTLRAGKAYIFVAENEFIRLKYSGAEVSEPLSDEADTRGLIGTFTNIAPGNLTHKYVIANNKLMECGSGAYLNAYRAYLDLDAMPAEALVINDGPGAAPRRRLGVAGNAPAVTTGMENVQGDNVQATKVLINGELFILRGEKMYDAKGQLVK